MNASGTWPAKARGCDNRFAELGRDLFQPGREIHRRADAGEIEAVAAADIAVHDLADMKRKAEPDRRLVLAGRRQLGDALLEFLRARERAPTNLADFILRGDGKDRQQAVAHEFEHLAAVTEHGRHLAAEIEVQTVDQRLRRQPLGDRGKAAHVRQPNRGADRLHIAAADLAGKNTLAGLVTDISVDQIFRRAPQRADFRDPRQRRDDRYKIGELLGR